MEKNVQAAIQFSKEHQNEFIADLGEFLRFRSISSSPVYKDESQKCVKWIVDYLKKMGAGETLILPYGSKPGGLWKHPASGRGQAYRPDLWAL